MKHILFLILLLAGVSQVSMGQQVQNLSYSELKDLLKNDDQKARVVNFWATWCKPCIEEMPHFIRAINEYPNAGIEFFFISVDFQSQHQKVVEKAKELGLLGTIVHLKESGNDWIDKMDQNWSGAIPYTILIFPDGKRVYHYDWFENYESLKTFLSENLTLRN